MNKLYSKFCKVRKNINGNIKKKGFNVTMKIFEVSLN